MHETNSIVLLNTNYNVTISVNPMMKKATIRLKYDFLYSHWSSTTTAYVCIRQTLGTETHVLTTTHTPCRHCVLSGTSSVKSETMVYSRKHTSAIRLLGLTAVRVLVIANIRLIIIVL